MHSIQSPLSQGVESAGALMDETRLCEVVTPLLGAQGSPV